MTLQLCFIATDLFFCRGNIIYYYRRASMRDRVKKRKETILLPSNSNTFSAETYTISSAVAHILKHNYAVLLPMVLATPHTYIFEYFANRYRCICPCLALIVHAKSQLHASSHALLSLCIGIHYQLRYLDYCLARQSWNNTFK